MTAAATLTLTEFLLARIAEDRARANADIEALSWSPSGHINGEAVLQQARRTRAECKAKRRIVEGCVESQYGWILGTLAAVYDDHPDYREEWRA